MGNLRYLIAAAAFAGAVATGCSSSSSTGVTGDSGPDSEHPGQDSGKDTGPQGGDSGKDSGGDGHAKDSSPDGVTADASDGPCNFATFVKGLIKNDTTATAEPSANLGQACTDDMNQADFASEFM